MSESLMGPTYLLRVPFPKSQYERAAAAFEFDGLLSGCACPQDLKSRMELGFRGLVDQQVSQGGKEHDGYRVSVESISIDWNVEPEDHGDPNSIVFPAEVEIIGEFNVHVKDDDFEFFEELLHSKFFGFCAKSMMERHAFDFLRAREVDVKGIVTEFDELEFGYG